MFTMKTCFSSDASFENDDGSYSIGYESQSLGAPEDSVYALLTKATGWTENTENDKLATNEKQFTTGISITKNVPYVEILKLIESFLRLKGEVVSRVHHLILDNSELIRAVHNTFIGKLATLHNFTLTGIVILRKIVEFASTLFGQWSFSVGTSINQQAQPQWPTNSYGSSW